MQQQDNRAGQNPAGAALAAKIGDRIHLTAAGAAVAEVLVEKAAVEAERDHWRQRAETAEAALASMGGL